MMIYTYRQRSSSNCFRVICEILATGAARNVGTTCLKMVYGGIPWYTNTSPFPWKMMISHQISMHPFLRQTHVENCGMNGMYSNKNHGTVPRTKDIGHQGIQSVYFPSGEYSTAGIKHNRTEQVHCQYLTHCQLSPRK